MDTITFSKPVVNPVMAIWSLGAPGTTASFNFTASEPFTIESGGPSAEFGGSAIFVCSGNSLAVCGTEGNGTIQFQGTFSTISWTNPAFENYYGFALGAPSSTSGRSRARVRLAGSVRSGRCPPAALAEGSAERMICALLACSCSLGTCHRAMAPSAPCVCAGRMMVDDHRIIRPSGAWRPIG